MSEKLETLLASLTLDERGELNAALARNLAATMDANVGSTNGSMVAAMVAASGEMREVVKSIFEGVSESDEFVADLFASLGDSAVS